MNCEEFDKLVILYTADEDIDPGIRKAFEDHFQSCKRCGAKFKRWIESTGTLEMEGVTKLFGPAPEVDKVDELLEFAELAEENGDYGSAIKHIREVLRLSSFCNRAIKCLWRLREKAFDENNPDIINALAMHGIDIKKRLMRDSELKIWLYEHRDELDWKELSKIELDITDEFPEIKEYLEIRKMIKQKRKKRIENAVKLDVGVVNGKVAFIRKTHKGIQVFLADLKKDSGKK